MAKKEETSQEETNKAEAVSGFSMPDMNKVVSIAKGAVCFVTTHVMSLVNMCKSKCCPSKCSKEEEKDKKE